MKESSNVIDGSRKALFFAFLGVLGFSGTLPATRAAVPYFGPVWIGLARAIVAAALAAAVLYVRGEKWPARRHLPGLAMVAGGCAVAFPLLSAMALRHVPSSHASVLIGVLPMATAVLGVVRGGERPSPAFWIAGAAGSLVVLSFSFADGGSMPRAEDVLLVLAVLCGAVGYAEGGRLARELGSLRVISWALVLAAPPIALVLAFTPPPDFGAVPVHAWFGFGYVSAISMFGAFIAWYAGLAGAGIARGSQVQLTQPFLSLIWAALFLGEKLEPRVWIAATAVVASVAVASRARMGTVSKASGRSPGHALSR